MIQRKPSKIIDSVVNSANEEHYTAAKAIRDNAPITDQVSVIKSVNFDSENDGSYILRKPLIKKANISDTSFYLYDHENIVNIEDNVLTIPGADKIILRWYDYRSLQKHDQEYTGNSINVPWLTVKSHFSCADHTLLSTTINHILFLQAYATMSSRSQNEGSGSSFLLRWYLWWNLALDNTPCLQRMQVVPPSPGSEWVNPYEHPNPEDFENDLRTLVTLKRFIKIYEDLDNPGTFIIEIIHPEINTFTSGLDTNNPEPMPVNLLLENPYSIRDLYNYGYNSVTKIVAYVPKEDLTVEQIQNKQIWELTETGFVHEHEDKTIEDNFRMLISTNPKNYSGNIVILKAFLTTAYSDKTYYGCWEVSKDDGVTWEVCEDFINKFKNLVEEILVSDVTSSEFDKMLFNDSLDEAKSYLVKKKVVPIFFGRSSVLASTSLRRIFGILDQQDIIKRRPDVLILENPNLSYSYRFQLYLKTDKEVPLPSEYTSTKTMTTFDATSGNILTKSENGQIVSRISYAALQNTGSSTPSLSNGKIILYPSSVTTGTGTEEDPIKKALGNTFTITVHDPTITILSVKFTFAYSGPTNPSQPERSFGAVIGAVPYGQGSVPNPEGSQNNENPYGMTDIWVFDNSPEGEEGTRFAYMYDAKNLYYNFNKSAGSQVTYYRSNFNDNMNYLTIVNLTGCLTESDRLEVSNILNTSPYKNDPDTYNVLSNFNIVLRAIEVRYTVQPEPIYTNIYLISTTGIFRVTYSDSTVLSTDLIKDRERIFNGNMYYNDNQAQLLIYSGNYIYSSNTNSSIFKLLNGISLTEEVTKLVPWRGYLLIFTPRNIYLSSYNAEIDGYNVKVLSNTVGVSKEDANTITPILNSIYFKSGTKIYRLVPNLYAAADDILNIHQVSVGINNILESIVNNNVETINFSFADADTYALFIPIQYTNTTYCIIYNFNRQVWTLLQYPTYLLGIEKFSTTEVYVKDSRHIYYFREPMSRLLALGLEQWCEENNDSPTNYNLQTFINAVMYADFLDTLPKELIALVLENETTGHSHEETFTPISTPIPFEIDFGQKSSNYTLDKQFLETKFILATLSIKDSFPVSIDIYTDGVSRDLHWDANTDGALWKKSLDDVGILNTGFGVDDQDYNGIFRQLIVKYSGKGKSIRHVLSGTSKALFKFYSMDVRGRILPKKH